MLHGLLADNVDTSVVVYNRCDAQWSAQSSGEPRKTCAADALSLCGSWASCSSFLVPLPPQVRALEALLAVHLL